MDDNSKKILRSTTKHLEVSFSQAIKDHNTICKNNNIDRTEYIESLIDNLRERNSLEHVTIKQILHREKAEMTSGLSNKLSIHKFPTEFNISIYQWKAPQIGGLELPINRKIKIIY
jgi:hypothetical protein